MRRYVKKQLLEMTDTLAEANRVLEKTVRSGTAMPANLLADEQDAAIGMGNQIEASEGEGTETVSLLETYCETLWQLSQLTAATEIQEKIGLLNSLLQQLRQAIQVMAEQTDVVFLPYKASMWDCMETVWEAAKADPMCHAYVIPIPYYDKKEDGSFGACHYEADLMPENVPVTSYLDYVIAERHPEVIFIHNPFDEYNRVTSVATEFYSRALKEHTDMLVYIPYFITDYHMPETHKFLPAYVYADKIILQNETMVDDLVKKVPREKLAVLGSPKAEKLLQLQKERNAVVPARLPEAWKKKVTDKRVVLYNISLTGILDHRQYAMKKLRYVLEQFQKREDVVVLWRPHPLIDTTLQTLAPNMWQEYRTIREWFVQADFGILDETPDAAAAAVLADAYIGESTSSMVYYFAVLGKPIFYLDWALTDEAEQKEQSFFFTDCYFEDGALWFIPRAGLAYDCLCKMDTATGAVTTVCKLPGEAGNAAKGNAYYGIVKLGTKVVLSPVWSCEIYVYDLETKKALKIPLPEADVEANFVNVFAYQGKAYLLPRNYPAVAELDVHTGDCIYHEVPDCGAEHGNGEMRFGGISKMAGSRLYFPRADRNSIVVFDMEQGSFSEIQLTETENGIYALTVCGNELWMVGDKTAEILCRNMETEQEQVWKEFSESFDGGIQPFREIIEIKNPAAGDKIVVFPEDANRYIIIDRNSGQLEERELSGGAGGYRFARIYEDVLYTCFAEKSGNAVVEKYHCLTGEHAVYKCTFDETEQERLLQENMDREYRRWKAPSSVTESADMSLPVFLRFLASGAYKYEKQGQRRMVYLVQHLNGECGKSILKMAKEGRQENGRVSE